jgi:uncharacterized protein (DUF3820 family)
MGAVDLHHFCRWLGGSEKTMHMHSRSSHNHRQVLRAAQVGDRVAESAIAELEQPITPESAAAYILQFGKYSGKPLGKLPGTYLRWVASNVPGRIAERARVVLEIRHGESGEVR